MIEVEKKFQPTEEQLENMLQGADFLGEKINIDNYYDTADFKYVKEGSRVRQRNGVFELKLKVVNPENALGSYYEEIQDEEKILEKLNLPKGADLNEFVNKNLILLCRIETVRREYRVGEFLIDVDKTDFGFNVCEVELMVENESQINEAENKIIEFANNFGITAKEKIFGKVMEYFKKFNPPLYQELFDIKYKIKIH